MWIFNIEYERKNLNYTQKIECDLKLNVKVKIDNERKYNGIWNLKMEFGFKNSNMNLEKLNRNIENLIQNLKIDCQF